MATVTPEDLQDALEFAAYDTGTPDGRYLRTEVNWAKAAAYVNDRVMQRAAEADEPAPEEDY